MLQGQDVRESAHPASITQSPVAIAHITNTSSGFTFMMKEIGMGGWEKQNRDTTDIRAPL
jgi:hypothetical protein